MPFVAPELQTIFGMYRNFDAGSTACWQADTAVASTTHTRRPASG
jgi:hypothetical protein